MREIVFDTETTGLEEFVLKGFDAQVLKERFGLEGN